jgi:hypothetical protein
MKPLNRGIKKAIIKARVNGPPNTTCHENTSGDPNPKSIYTSFNSPI